MHKIIFYIILIILLVGTFNYFKNKKADQAIYLYKESGVLFTKSPKETDYKKVDLDKIEIENNSWIKTDEGTGFVILPDNSSIVIGKNTEILVNYNKKKTSITELSGQTFHKVSSLVTGNNYEVKTPNTLASVRGTGFAVLYDNVNNKSSVAVTENEVEVAKVDKDGKIVNVKKVSKGQLVHIYSNKNEITSSSLNEDKSISSFTNKSEELQTKIDSLKENKDTDVNKDANINKDADVNKDANLNKDVNINKDTDVNKKTDTNNTDTNIDTNKAQNKKISETDFSKEFILNKIKYLNQGMRCEYDDQGNKMLIYLPENKKIKGTFTSNQKDKKQNYTYMLDGPTLYIWSEEDPAYAVKIDINKIKNDSDSENLSATNTNIKDSCLMTKVEDGIFKIPTDRNFTEEAENKNIFNKISDGINNLDVSSLIDTYKEYLPANFRN